jgi:enoyl-CoA hydratase
VDDHLQVERNERVAWLTLARPEARNALTRELIDALVESITALDADPTIDVMVLTGSDPVFCAGLDLTQIGPGGALDVGPLTKLGNPWPRRSTPLVGAINGPAITGGLELALYCDILIASERAQFGDTHARVGVLPFWGLTVALPRAVGLRTATAMSLTGNFLSAEDAYRLGLVYRVVPHDQLISTAHGIAVDITSTDQATARAMFRAYRDARERADESALREEQSRALAWQGEGLDADAVRQRRAAVIARGSAQQARPEDR